MKLTRRAKRMQEHHARRKDRTASLNMVSLMDIFTILVFFLLVNASNSEVLPLPKNIVLPDSSAEKAPLRKLVIAVDKQQILLEGQPVMRVPQALGSQSATLRPLYQALLAKRGKVRDVQDPKGIVIMADKEIPYALLKKIMLTASGANFTNISFAVNRKAGKADG